MVRNRGMSISLFAVLALANSYAIGCSKSQAGQNNIGFACDGEPNPPRVGLNTFTVKLASTSGGPLTGAHVSLEGDMSHAGMAPVFGETRELAPGRYQGTLDLNMRGDWVVLFHIALANGETVDRQLEVRNIKAR
jgi:hypothetical protein